MDPNDLQETFAPGRNFANKIWNAGRFALMNIGDSAVAAVDDVVGDLELADRWILSRLDAATQEMTRQLEAFRFHDAADAAYQFFWRELADWYLEMIKLRMRDDAEPSSRAAAAATLVESLDGILRLLHPIMPFITEALWSRLPVPAGRTRGESLVPGPWPDASGRRRDAAAEAQMAELMELIIAVRGLRSEYKVPPGTVVDVRLSNVGADLRAALAVERRALQRLAQVGEIADGGNGAGGRAGAHAVLRNGAELFIPLTGIIDVDQERDRLRREIERLDAQLEATEKRLADQKFVGRAPEEVVARERDKAANFRDQRDRLSGKLADLG
jgi:valyl-tRNA synthetase